MDIDIRIKGALILLTHQRLKEILHYDPDTGFFTWLSRAETEWRDVAKGRAWNTMFAGKRAGVTTHGYVRLSVDDTKHYAHRLAWLYMTGEWPPNLVDHINNCGTDNRWENLRSADKAINFRNPRNKKRANKTGLVGAVLLPSGRYMAQITKNAKHRYLGSFDTAEEAHRAYIAALHSQTPR